AEDAADETVAQPLSLHVVAFSLPGTSVAAWQQRCVADGTGISFELDVDHRRVAEGRSVERWASASRCPSRSSLQKRARASAQRRMNSVPRSPVHQSLPLSCPRGSQTLLSPIRQSRAGAVDLMTRTS